MEIVQLKDDVFVIDNVIPKEECDAIIRYLDAISSAGHLDWNQISFYGSFAMGYWPWDDNLLVFGLPRDYFSQLKEKIKKVGEECFGRELSEVSYHAQKWVVGAFASFHSDNTHEDGTPSAFYKSKYAGFMYLNDNFDGGHLNFKHHDIVIRPKPGRLAFFKGGFGNEHEVTTVKEAERYTVGSFWDNADAVYTPEQVAEWERELKQTRAEQEETYKEWAAAREQGMEPTYKGKYD
jgi:Rps23 Pro-64 3,4-dihydroxylase Tpa1-like proline 4-hydroxylase